MKAYLVFADGYWLNDSNRFTIKGFKDKERALEFIKKLENWNSTAIKESECPFVNRLEQIDSVYFTYMELDFDYGETI